MYFKHDLYIYIFFMYLCLKYLIMKPFYALVWVISHENLKHVCQEGFLIAFLGKALHLSYD